MGRNIKRLIYFSFIFMVFSCSLFSYNPVYAQTDTKASVDTKQVEQQGKRNVYVSLNKLEEIIKEQVEAGNKEKLTLTEYESNGRVVLKSSQSSYYTIVPKSSDFVAKIVQEYDLRYIFKAKTINWWSVIAIGVLIYIISRIVSNRQKAKYPNMLQENSFDNKKGKKEKDGMQDVPKVSFDDIGGLSDETKEELKHMIKLFNNKDQALELGIRPAKGLLLYGPPGTGKTLLARVLANEIGATFYSTSGSQFMELFVGVGPKRIRELFEKARKTSPAIVFIDEIDAIAGERKVNATNDESDRTLNQLLTELDGIIPMEDVFFVAATNRLDMLDKALLRPGRIDYKISIGLPDLKGRLEILNIHIKGKKVTEEVQSNVEKIARMTTGCSGAELENLFLSAANYAFMNGRNEIAMGDIYYALDRLILGNETTKISEYSTKERVAYHEGGHALIAVLTDPDSVRKATIIPRGDALGYVAPVPKELELSTKTQLMDRLMMILAGGIAEKVVYGEHSVGVAGDIQQAKQLIERMVDYFGMGKDGYSLSFNKGKKDELMDKIFAEAANGCEHIIRNNFDKLELLAKALLEQETLDGEEVKEIILGKLEQNTSKLVETTL
ncbi:MAG: AAA family ATPase [Bacillaceae bacterium]